jgi:hypothetical protein
MWAGGFFALAAVVAIAVVVFPSPGKRAGEKTSPGGELVDQGTPASFAPKRDEVLGLAQQFVATAVARKNVASSFDMVCPDMKDGFTRQKWAKGNIPVVPFPVYSGKWRLSYSLSNEIDLQVALYAKPKAKMQPVVFDLTMQPCGKENGKRWLVESFIPTPSKGTDFGSRSPMKDPNNPFGIGTSNPKPLPHQASNTWLLVPVAAVGGLLILVLGFFGIRGVRGRRAYAAHVRERQISNSRPS